MASAIDAAMATAARLYRSGDLQAARSTCEGILQADARHFYALHLASTIALREGRGADCVALATRALHVDPDHPEVLSNRGAGLRTMCRFAEALADYERALSVAPGSPGPLVGRGVALAALGRFGDAIACYDAALAIDPANARTRYNRALSHLALGHYREGWADYESRWAGGENPMLPRPFDMPEFRDADWGKGHRTALWTEQGLGDQLLFASLAADFAALGEAFVLEIDARLVAPLKRAHPEWHVVANAQSAAAFAACDRHLAPRLGGALPAQFGCQLRKATPGAPRARPFAHRALPRAPGQDPGPADRSVVAHLPADAQVLRAQQVGAARRVRRDGEGTGRAPRRPSIRRHGRRAGGFRPSGRAARAHRRSRSLQRHRRRARGDARLRGRRHHQ
jgi:hypothetical protein